MPLLQAVAKFLKIVMTKMNQVPRPLVMMTIENFNLRLFKQL